MTIKTSIRVLEAEDADMYRIFEICSLAFQRNEPFFDASWPNHWLVSGRKAGAARMRQNKHSDPHATFLKAVDESSGEILGMAKWNVYDNSLPDLDTRPPVGDHWETAEEKQYAEHLAGVFFEERNAAIKASKGNLVSLDILAIDPAYQRRGVGDALVKWGTRKADGMGVDAVVESSVFGRGLYEKNGFVFLRDVELRVPEKWQERPKQRFAWLVRPKREVRRLAS